MEYNWMQLDARNVLCGFLCIAFFVHSVYRWSISTFNHFENLGVPFVKPVPLFGGSLKLLLAKEHLLDHVNGMYTKFKGKKVFGNYEMRKPMLIIRDPEVIKLLTVKDNEYFLDHRTLTDESVEPLFGKNLFLLKGQRWKDMRTLISPVFTGSKIREMFGLLVAVAERAIKHLDEESIVCPLSVDTKDITARFTSDVIATTAFGLEVNSFKHRDNEFYVMGKILSSSSVLFTIKILLSGTFSKLARFLRIRLFPQQIERKFTKIVIDTMEERSKLGIVRRDIIQLLMEANKESEKNDKNINTNHTKKWNITDLVAQCFVFFFAGFDNVSLLMCFVIQELVENTSIQDRLYHEIRQTNLRLDGVSLTYDVLQGMPYLDQVISETLRKWPLAAVTDRVCTKPYSLEVDNLQIPIEVNDVIQIPIYGIHRDPDNFENPDVYDPDRFNEKNKHKIKPMTYLPFGAGPRTCIASRFALMEAKALIYYLLGNFSFGPTEKTQIPLKLSKTSGFSLMAENGFHVKLKRRM